MAKEYIEREAAINSLTEENLVLNLDSVMDGLSNQIKRSAHRILASLPTADVVARDCYDRLLAENDELRKERPVRHGRWILKEDGRAHCSECDTAGNSYVWHYCPNCGARMDGEKGDNQ